MANGKPGRPRKVDVAAQQQAQNETIVPVETQEEPMVAVAEPISTKQKRAPMISIADAATMDERALRVQQAKSILGEKAHGMRFFYQDRSDSVDALKSMGMEPVVIEGQHWNHKGDPLYMGPETDFAKREKFFANLSREACNSAIKLEGETLKVRTNDGKTRGVVIPEGE